MKFTKAALKFTFAITFALTILFSSSCKKDEDCLIEATGTYLGVEVCQNQNTVNNIIFAITPSATDNEVVITLTGSTVVFNGVLQSNCTSILISDQTVASNGLVGVIDGKLSIYDNKLSGMLDISGNTCSYNFIKQ